jgi:hypothetical protein
MDCGTCETAGPIQVVKPDVVEVSLTISDNAQAMLADAFGDDRSMALLVGVLSGGCSGYMYDLANHRRDRPILPRSQHQRFQSPRTQRFQPSLRWDRN